MLLLCMCCAMCEYAFAVTNTNDNHTTATPCTFTYEAATTRTLTQSTNTYSKFIHTITCAGANSLRCIHVIVVTLVSLRSHSFVLLFYAPSFICFPALLLMTFLRFSLISVSQCKCSVLIQCCCFRFPSSKFHNFKNISSLSK